VVPSWETVKYRAAAVQAAGMTNPHGTHSAVFRSLLTAAPEAMLASTANRGPRAIPITSPFKKVETAPQFEETASVS
jgi:hypothetical protein